MNMRNYLYVGNIIPFCCQIPMCHTTRQLRKPKSLPAFTCITSNTNKGDAQFISRYLHHSNTNKDDAEFTSIYLHQF